MKTLKNKTSKSICYILLWTLAVVIVSCNDNLEVDITPVYEPPQEIIYNTADCNYYGDILGNGAAFFELNLYHSSNSNIGLLMMGFCALPNSFANFRLDAGTYNPAINGAVRTFLPGMFEDETFIGTCLYDLKASKVIFITSGTMTVALSGNTYTIKGDFSGKDAVTNVEKKDIKITFTGTIKFTDVSSPDPLTVKSSYTATGTPKWLSIPGDATWTGTLEPEGSGNDKWYKITNWGNDDITVYCDVDNGKIVMDNYTRVEYNNTYDGYFEVGYIDGGYLHVLPYDDYIVNYNSSTRILDFTGTVTNGGKTYEAVVGVAAYNRSTGNLESVFTDFYAGVKLKLTPVSSTRSSNKNLADVIKNTNLSQKINKPVNNRKPINIVVDDSLRSKIQKIPLEDLKVINGR